MHVFPRIPGAALPKRSVTEVADLVFSATSDSVVSVGGVSPEQVLQAIDDADRGQYDRLAAFIPLEPSTSAERIVEQVADRLAEISVRRWPVWFTDVDFGDCGDDTLGREAARIMVRQVANETPTVLRPWAEAAVILALEGHKPRVPNTTSATELEQLCLAIDRNGLILIVNAAAAQTHPAALVHALEWMSHKGRVAVVALFPVLPDNAPPFDRILHRAVCVTGEPDEIVPALPGEEPPSERPWLVPVRGIPHPLSDTEQRLAKALARDGELAPLFGFNQFVETVRGNRPKVDLLWTAGRLVVELDGYADHGTRAAFMRDRHRDYELTLSGYTVLRLPNDEISQDIEKAVEKIRDVVQLCRARTA